MLSNQRIPSFVILALLAIAGASIDTANAQGPRLYKLDRGKLALGFKALPDWFGTSLLRAGKATTEFFGKAPRSPRESVVEDLALLEKEPHPASPAYKPGFRQEIIIKREVQVVRSFFDDGRPQIVAELIKGGDLSEEETAMIFRDNAVAAAAKSRETGFEFDLESATINFKKPISIWRGRVVVLNGIAIGTVAKAAARYYRACRKGMNNEMANMPPSDRDTVSGLVAKCVDGTLARLGTDIGEYFSDSETRAVAPENVD
jgi:hypothetical protein